MSTVLVANRGEIAVRLVRAAQLLGLRTVAVFSDADRGSPHVLLADHAVRLGPAAPSESYLRADAIVDAAMASGADLIHPGYGFLSEDADFAEAVEGAGLTFVGPTPHQLRVFGTKHTARAAAMAAGVPVFAGSDLLDGSADAVAAADTIGYPVMLKATGGGGGIGMQVCRSAAELRAAFDRVTRLAERSFGSAGVFVERFVERARHVEVQIFGDGSGRVVSLGDRDCSLQRRNQKVIEEAPAPGLPDDVRALLHSSSRALAGSVAYRSAGTVEFVYDAERREASFLEVNARLQVEHPVTEAVTGIDLAGWMFRLARGERGLLDAHPDGEVPVRGHAVEARVYAEDPARDYRPSTGTLTSVAFPGQAGCASTPGSTTAPRSLRSTTRCSPRSSRRAPIATRRSTRWAPRSTTPCCTASRSTWGCCAPRSTAPTSARRRTAPLLSPTSAIRDLASPSTVLA